MSLCIQFSPSDFLYASYLSFKIESGNFLDPFHSGLAALKIENNFISDTNYICLFLCISQSMVNSLKTGHILFCCSPGSITVLSHLIHFGENTFFSSIGYNQVATYNQQTTQLIGFNFHFRPNGLYIVLLQNRNITFFYLSFFSTVTLDMNLLKFPHLSGHMKNNCVIYHNCLSSFLKFLSASLYFLRLPHNHNNICQTNIRVMQ